MDTYFHFFFQFQCWALWFQTEICDLKFSQKIHAMFNCKAIYTVFHSNKPLCSVPEQMSFKALY